MQGLENVAFYLRLCQGNKETKVTSRMRLGQVVHESRKQHEHKHRVSAYQVMQNKHFHLHSEQTKQYPHTNYHYHYICAPTHKNHHANCHMIHMHKQSVIYIVCIHTRTLACPN